MIIPFLEQYPGRGFFFFENIFMCRKLIENIKKVDNTFDNTYAQKYAYYDQFLQFA